MYVYIWALCQLLHVLLVFVSLCLSLYVFHGKIKNICWFTFPLCIWWITNYFLHLLAWHLQAAMVFNRRMLKSTWCAGNIAALQRHWGDSFGVAFKFDSWWKILNYDVQAIKTSENRTIPLSFLLPFEGAPMIINYSRFGPSWKAECTKGHQQTLLFHLFHLCCCSCMNWLMIFSHMLLLTCLTCLISTPAVSVFLLSSGLKLVTGCVSVETCLALLLH